MSKLYILILITFLAGCASNSDEKVRYKSSNAYPTLEIPPDLTQLDDSQNLALPGSKIGTRQATGRFKDEGPLLERVLPRIENVSIQGSGDYHWLSVDFPITDTYKLMKQFWIEEGFTLQKDEPLIGIMETEWLENKAGLMQSDNFFLALLASMSSTDTLDQFRTRLERDENGMTNIYIAHKGREYILMDEDESRVVERDRGWQPRPNDPELEVEMLSRAMIFMGLQDEKVSQQLKRIGKFQNRAKLLSDDDGAITLMLLESYDRAWNRTLLNLQRMDIEITEQNKSDAQIKFKQQAANETSENADEEPGFFSSLFSSDEETAPTMEIELALNETTNESTQVDVIASDGTVDNSEQSKQILRLLFEKLK